MQKNWYIIYTKPKCEKKVAALLTKKRIENFSPVNCKEIKSSKKSKVIYEPLFDCYVFTYIDEKDIDQLKQIDRIVSLVYWKGMPAIINDDEIKIIKEFTSDYQNIKLVRNRVNINDLAGVIEGPSYSLDGKVLTVKNKKVKVNLPSLGFIMIAELEKESIRYSEVSFVNRELSLLK
ncbi:MAG: UpxY family transcription antiterminator [Ginsengibacter sp.]